MNSELEQLSRHINRHHWLRARLLAARLSKTELRESADFWFQVALLADLLGNQRLSEAAKEKMLSCKDYQPIKEVDRKRNDGLNWLRRGHIEKARTAFAEALRLLGNVQPGEFNRTAANQDCLGRLEAAQANYPEAIEAFRRALGIWTGAKLFTLPGPNSKLLSPISEGVNLWEGAVTVWVNNCCFHFLRTLAAANSPEHRPYATACYNFVLQHDESRARRLWARLFYRLGPRAAKLYTWLQHLRYRQAPR